MNEKEILAENTFIASVYEVLREFQDGKIEKTNVVCGKLTDELTVVLDRIVEAYRDKNK